jgi:hypothetical protein
MRACILRQAMSGAADNVAGIKDRMVASFVAVRSMREVKKIFPRSFKRGFALLANVN